MKRFWISFFVFAVALASIVPASASAGDVYKSTCRGSQCGQRLTFFNCTLLVVQEVVRGGEVWTEVWNGSYVIRVKGRHQEVIRRAARDYGFTFGTFNFNGDACGWCIWVNWDK
jgi:hypothetical protein